MVFKHSIRIVLFFFSTVVMIVLTILLEFVIFNSYSNGIEFKQLQYLIFFFHQFLPSYDVLINNCDSCLLVPRKVIDCSIEDEIE